MNGTTTLFDTDAPGHAATVEVLGVIFSAEDDGYAVLEVRTPIPARASRWSARSPTCGAGDRAEVSGEWQTHARYGRQLRARGALPLDPADREGRIAYLTSLRHIGPARAERLVDEHGEGVLGAIAADPAWRLRLAAGVSAEQAAAAAESWHASRAVRDLHVQLAPHGLAHLAAPIHTRFGDSAMAILHEDPIPADRGRRGRLRPRRQDRARRRRAAGVRPPRPGRRRLRSRRGRAAGPQPTCRWPSSTRRTAKLLGLDPDPEVLAEAPRPVRRRGPHLPRADPRPASSLSRRRCAARAAPPYLDHEPGREPADAEA